MSTPAFRSWRLEIPSMPPIGGIAPGRTREQAMREVKRMFCRSTLPPGTRLVPVTDARPSATAGVAV